MERFKTIEECKNWLKYNDFNELDVYNQNILFYQRDLEIIKYLIENTNINVNQLSKSDENILFYQNDLETIKYLIENTDINVNQLDCINVNILSYEVDLEIVKYLIENTNIDIKHYLNNYININDVCHNCYNYIKSFYEKRELEKELNKIISIKKNKEKVKKI